MLEDDLRYFPMATTDYLQRIRTSELYQDGIKVDAMLSAIAHAVELLSAQSNCSVDVVSVDWVNYRLCLVVYDLARGLSAPKAVKFMECRIHIIMCTFVQSAVTRWQSHDNPGVAVLVDDLRDWEASGRSLFDCHAILGYMSEILVTELTESSSNYVVEFLAVERISHTEAPHIDGFDYCPPPTKVPPFEEHSIKDIGKFSAISSSKQQPLLAVLDGLYYWCSTEDA